MTAVAACRTCGTEPLANARLCHGCGSPVDDGDTHAEYKQVTVLFANVVHSMDIAAATARRGTDADVAEAEVAIERLAAAPADEGLVIREIWLLRLRALLARAHGDAEAYKQLRDRYRDMAKMLGFEGHIAWAEAMA
jgi:hypothetical protein